MYIFSFGIIDTTVATSRESQEWDDGISYFRLAIRSGDLFLDQTMTPLGFSGSIGVDWDIVWDK